MSITASIPDVKADAAARLKAHGITCTQVIAVDVEHDCDSILFLGVNRQARTAWMRVQTLPDKSEIVRVAHETGFLAEPPAWVVRKLWPDPDPSDTPTTP